MIVDVHAHLGDDYTFGDIFSRQPLIDKIDDYGVDIQIVQPGTTHEAAEAVLQHNAISDLCREYPGKFYGMANPSPHLRGQLYESEIARCVEELGFVGIKLHPYAHGVHPDSKPGRKAFDAARKYGIPLMVHTGAGYPFSAPVHLIGLAKEYSDVKIIMAHCGNMIFADEVTAVFEACPNAYGDTSWTPGYLMMNWTNWFGSRLMLASDHAANIGTELAKIKTFGFSGCEQEAMLGKTALEVYFPRA